MNNVLIIVNKSKSALGPSETFILAHINRLPCKVQALIGIPGYRKIFGTDKYLSSRSFAPLSLRWLKRRIFSETVAEQDTKALADFIRHYNFDAVLAEYGPTATTVMRACVQTRKPLIAHFHGWDAYSKYILTTYKAEYRKLFDVASAIVAVSSHMRNRLIEMGAPSKITLHNACGADIPQGVRACPEKAGRRFVMVGRLTAKKSPITSIEAFAKVNYIFRDSTLDILGDGPLMEDVVKLIKKLNLSDSITLHGAKPHEYVIEVLKKASCFIQHSVVASNGDHEGTPVGVLEAMLMGLPVVATKHGGILDVIEDGETGMLVEEHDMEAMSEKMMRLAENPVLASKMGKIARKRAMDHHTVDKSVGNLWKIILSCVEN